jgi:acyl carrier protein
MMKTVPENLEQQVIDVLAKRKKIDPAGITADTTFEQLGIDSLDAADLLFTFEDDFGVVIPDETAQSMRSVGQVVEGLRGLIAAKAGPV